jgi:hypothetical protein
LIPFGVRAALPLVSVSPLDGVPDEAAEEATDDTAAAVVGANAGAGSATVAGDATGVSTEAGGMAAEVDEDSALWAEPLPPSRPARLHSPDRLSPCLRPAREAD